ncbi:LANO_0D05424g1_1 [Lachancea nothofagi CBS 11611]|uniref:Peroxisomal hydratase-dehydrogenase-epimerase n=1 Tax=Lachancea nothofagi CBS 11611 TaxID=1266666 RepID=A0A1G4JH57_9SACH|nr:LANO_0D05424g1_1 [Lachancea nothofagi CBS 11611]
MTEDLSFKNRVVVITGAGGGLGRVYALEFAKRGANVVVNDLGGSLGGQGHNARAADVVVAEIKDRFKIEAAANYDSVTDNAAGIVQTAIDRFGRVDVIINNAGILRDSSFAKMQDAAFESVVDVHLNGAYKLSKAAWPYFRRQNFGRVVNTCSPAGLYGNFGQANYSAAKMGLVGFSETLAKEGYKNNINVNCIVPLARSRMTESIIPPHILKNLAPEKIAPMVLYLCHESTKVTNSIFELAAGFYSQIRWERSSGQIFNPSPESFTAEAILDKWSSIVDYTDKPFNKVSHPIQLSDYNALIAKARQLPANSQGSGRIESLKGKVVIVTGAGAGLGKSHALSFAKYGAKVVINDIRDPYTAATEIQKLYGEDSAVADKHDVVTQAQEIIETAIKHYGKVDVLINNAGILRDRSFVKMTDEEWLIVLKVHLYSTYGLCNAVWPVFLKQGGGYIINTTSTSGIYGNFGQANYAAAKAAILGLSKTLALEGLKANIKVNIVAPHAETAMTKTIFSEKELGSHFDPSQVSPFFVLLATDELSKKVGKPVTGQLFEVGGGWCGQTRWQRSKGVVSLQPSPEFLRDNWKNLVDFRQSTHPTSTQDSSMSILQSVTQATESAASKALFKYSERDVILYNLGLGCTSQELKYCYENDPNFQVLPTFGVIPFMSSGNSIKMDSLVENFNYAFLLHGEQYFKLNKFPIPTKGKLKTIGKPIQVLDKGGKAAVIIGGYQTINAETNETLFYNEATFFIRGAHAPKAKQIKNARAKFAVQPFKAPETKPDFEIEITTDINQAAIYRLSGDFNPLHIDPTVAKMSKFPRPILHGLCTLGVTGKVLYEKFGQFDEFKVRFTNVVYPGDRLKVKAWKQPNGVVIFQTFDLDKNYVVLDNAALKLVGGKANL